MARSDGQGGRDALCLRRTALTVSTGHGGLPAVASAAEGHAIGWLQRSATIGEFNDVIREQTDASPVRGVASWVFTPTSGTLDDAPAPVAVRLRAIMRVRELRRRLGDARVMSGQARHHQPEDMSIAFQDGAG